MNSTIDVVNEYYKKTQDALKVLNDAKADRNNFIVNFEAASNANYGRDGWVPADKNSEYYRGIMSQKDTAVLNAQTAYDSAEKVYLQKQETLLTETQKNQLKDQQDAETREKNANSAKTEAEAVIAAQAASYSAQRSKVILFVGVGVVLVGIGLFVYFKFFKKPAI